ncbi:MAG TPA: hypothetical protein VLS49_01490 [Usitatibacter sp.]|nr:hypothetical protein [Usitatibacter sp.]
MSRRVLVVIAILVVVIGFGTAMTLKRALRIGASHADPDGRPPAPSAPR